ncbi:MAG: PBP1A family penicillin-binding protein [Desulfobacteraceae bacterium]|nr:MAG: PBP1A family penicillin-binding protein [Desulfobacteraceae bacterium]
MSLKKTFLFCLVLIPLSFLIGLFFYGRMLSNMVETRFSGTRWQIPSRVYSDTMLLFPGQRLQLPDFYEKLRRLHYRKVEGFPKYKGEMRISDSVLDIYLYDAAFRNRKREGFPLRIRFLENQVESIEQVDSRIILPVFELEPEELMLFFGPERERRRLVSIQHVPDHLIKAVMAIEDNRFYQHHGISFMGILRAMWINIRHGKMKQGASTITQQLAKNYFLSSQKTISRKLKEALIALILEVKFSKQEILEIYFNEIYLGQRGSESINGIGEASFFYFGKPTDELTPAESAVIAGLIKGPNLYSPYTHKEACLKRRNMVLQAMHKNHWIGQDELDMLLKEPIQTTGYNAHPRWAPYFADYLYQQLKDLYSREDLSSLGLSIYTTLDTQAQKAAESALSKGLERLENRKPSLHRDSPEKKLQGAVIVMQPKTGNILAMVGGRNYSISQFNRISQARRQAGSAFKPFVFLAALDQFTPASILSNESKVYSTEKGEEWIPENFEPVSEETSVSMRTALSKSHNRATVDLAMKVGLDQIIRQARAFHFSTPLEPYPSLALGSFEMIPLELVRAYCIFAADGFQPYPLSLKNITDASGTALNRKHMEIERTTSPEKAFIISSMLRSAVVDGTGKAIGSYGISFPAAGKTGTTSNFRDAWFIGYTPDIITLVWVGFDNGDPIYFTGSQAALPIWAELMNSIPHQLSGSWFAMPQGVVKRKICPESGLLPIPFVCPEEKEEFFLSGNIPEEYCSVHKVRMLDQLMKGLRSIVP